MQANSIDKNIHPDKKENAFITDQPPKKMMVRITIAQGIFLSLVAAILILTATLGLTLGYIFGYIPAFALVLLPIGPIIALFCLSIYLYKKKSSLLSKITTQEPTDDSMKRPMFTQGPDSMTIPGQHPPSGPIDPAIEDLDPSALEREDHFPVDTPPTVDSGQYRPTSPLEDAGHQPGSLTDEGYPNNEEFQEFDPFALEDVVSPFGPEGGAINLDDSGIPFIIPPDRDIPPSPILGVAVSIPPLNPGTSASPTPTILPPASISRTQPLVPTPSASPTHPETPTPFVLAPGQLPQSPVELLKQVDYILGDHCWKITLQDVERRIYGERTHRIHNHKLQIFAYNPFHVVNRHHGRITSLLEGIILSHHPEYSIPSSPNYKLPPKEGDKTAFIFTGDFENPPEDQTSRRGPVVKISRLHLPNTALALSAADISCYDLTGIPQITISYPQPPGFVHFTRVVAPRTEDHPLCAIYAHIYCSYLDIFSKFLAPRLLHPGIEHLALNIEALDFPDMEATASAEGLSIANIMELENNIPYAACLQALLDSRILETSSLLSEEGLTVHLLLNIVNFTSV